MTIYGDLLKLAPGALIEMFELDASAIGDALYRFFNGRNELAQPLVWQGNTYTSFPVEGTGFEITGQGKIPRPKLRLSNVDQQVGALVRSVDDLVGAKVTRRRTLKKYLDAVNFAGGVNPDADPAARLPDDVYFIERKAFEGKATVEFELCAPWDVHGVQLPRRIIVQNCTFRYRGPDCGYTGPAVADAADNPTTALSLDACSKHLTGCKKRFGETAELPFGGFPAAGVFR